MVINEHDIELFTAEKERRKFIARWAWQKFSQLFPDESSCIIELYKRIKKRDIVICDSCQSPTIRVIDARRSLCLSCHRTNWHTAHTPFAGAKKVRPWFAALWLQEQGVQMTGKQFAELAGVSHSTGATMVRRVALMTNQFNSSFTSILQPAASQNLIELNEFKTPSKIQEPDLASEAQIPSTAQTKSIDESRVELQRLRNGLYDLLSETPQSLEVLANKLNTTADMVSTACVMLELDQLVTRTKDYKLVRRARKESTSNARNEEETIHTREKAESNDSASSCSILAVLRKAIHDVSRIISKEASRMFGYCKNCKRKLAPKKI